MFTQERTFSLYTVGALTIAVVVTFLALVHSLSELKVLW